MPETSNRESTIPEKLTIIVDLSFAQERFYLGLDGVLRTWGVDISILEPEEFYAMFDVIAHEVIDLTQTFGGSASHGVQTVLETIVGRATTYSKGGQGSSEELGNKIQSLIRATQITSTEIVRHYIPSYNTLGSDAAMKPCRPRRFNDSGHYALIYERA